MSRLPVAHHIAVAIARPCQFGGVVGDVRSGQCGRCRAGRCLIHSHIVQINVGIATSAVGSSLEDENHLLSGVCTEDNRILFGPAGCTCKPGDERRGVGFAAVGGDIDGEVAACGILVPEAQLHGRRCRQAERDTLQTVIFTTGWVK